MLTGTAESISVSPNAEIVQKTVRTRYKVPALKNIPIWGSGCKRNTPWISVYPRRICQNKSRPES